MHAASWSVGYRGILSDAWLDSAVWADRAALWRERFAAAAPERYLAVAHEDGSVVGFVCAQQDADPRYGSLIDSVHVHPSATGRGIGSELLAIAFEALRRERPDAGVYLWLYEQNVAARRLYQRLGTRLAETTVQSTPGGAAPLCRYAWDCEPSAPLAQRWISIAPCTWHQAVVPPGDDWVVMSFHAVDAGDLLEEKAGSVRRYLGA